MSNRIFALSICASAIFTCVTTYGAETASNNANTAPTRMLKSDYRIGIDKLKADYKAAKKICEGKQGEDERTCSKDAQEAHEKAERDLKAAFYGTR